MTYYWIKIAVTTALIVAISEISRRSTLVGAILASVPLVSVLAMMWLYIDTGDTTRVSNLSSSVFWLVLPSLILFIALPILLRNGIDFYISMLVSIGLTTLGYFGMIKILARFGVSL